MHSHPLSSLSSLIGQATCLFHGLLAVGLLASCGGEEDPSSELVPGDPAELYQSDHIVQVAVEIDRPYWDELRFQSRPVSSLSEGCDQGPPPEAYTVFPAHVQIDGTAFDDVGVRKKGFLGSASVIRPSLVLDMNEFAPDQAYGEITRVTLNNNRQDPSVMRTCLAYHVFQAAGIEAPRCNFARVVVNGKDLGIYSNVDPIKKPFLLARFGDDTGTLYEGQVSDFTDEDYRTFEVKTNTEEADLSHIAAAVSALAVEDNLLLPALDAVFDLDQVLTFLAVETLVGHIDGYSAQLNNFFVYNLPTDGKLRFIPWGPDTAFSHQSAVLPDDRPQAVFGQGMLARRIYQHPEGRKLYLGRLRQLLDEVWDEDALLGRVAEFEGLLGDQVDSKDVDSLKAFIRGRREEIELELPSPRDWTVPRVFECLYAPTEVTGEFDTEWGTLSSLDPAFSGNLRIMLDEQAQQFRTLVSMFGTDKESGSELLRLFGIRVDGSTLVVQMNIEPTQFQTTDHIPFHGFETVGAVGLLDESLNFSILGYITDGALDFSDRSRQPGAPVRGTFQGRFYVVPPDMLLGNRSQNTSN